MPEYYQLISFYFRFVTFEEYNLNNFLQLGRKICLKQNQAQVPHRLPEQQYPTKNLDRL